jgi:hypothetical protein
MVWPHKLIVGKIQQSGWCGEVHPNNTLPWDSFASVEQCNTSAKIGCLFNVLEGALLPDACARVCIQSDSIFAKKLITELPVWSPYQTPSARLVSG